MVVNHVEDDLDSGGMQMPHHLAEFCDCAARAARGVTRIGRKVSERVVAPVVSPAAPDEKMLVDMIMHREQLDRGDAQLAEVPDGGQRGNPA